MTEERKKELVSDTTISLTEEEIIEGWHFCSENGYVLINWKLSMKCLCFEWANK